MNINSINVSNSVSKNDSLYEVEKKQPAKPPIHSDNTVNEVDTKRAIDEATGLMQTIVSEKSSEDVIRKMPPDEYLHLLSLLDDIISGSIDKHV